MSFSEWKEVKLEEIINIEMGQSPKSEFYNSKCKGLPFLQGNRTFGDKYPSFDTYCTDIKKIAQTDDVIMSVRAPVGDLNIATEKICIGRGVCAMSMKNQNNMYLFYLLKHNIKKLINRESGTVFGSVNKNDINTLEVLYTSNDNEQKETALILSCLDEKIYLNNRINKNLEDIAQAIFKSWFVDFEPFQDGEFEDSELGPIPAGWRIGALGDYVTSIDNRGKTPPLSIQKTPYPIIDVKALSGESRIINYTNCTKYVDEETYNNWFRSGNPMRYDILISTVGSLAEMKIFYGEKGCVAQNVVGLRSKSISALLLYQYLQNIKQDLISYNIGSVQPSIKVTHIIKHKILVPTEEVLQLFEATISEISNLIFNNFQENQALITIRDSLLPKLMSGEIRVPKEEVQ